MPVPSRLIDKVAGLVVVRLGSNMRPPRRAEADAAGVRGLLSRYPLGGMILFNGQWPATRETLADLQLHASRPLLVMTDMERGLGQQVAGATVFPHARAFGALDAAEERTEQFARAAAREALACGVHVALAPVADVDRNPANPIISTRAFGSEPERAAALATAFVRGARAEGLLTTAKHFPGHGGTSEDSHAVLPRVEDARDVLDRVDLAPFRATIAAGCELVMTAHVAYPALDPSGRPATLSAPILIDLLRGELGFRGAVISDSLHMGGIQEDGRTEADLAVAQIAAGVDLLLDPEDPARLIEGVAAAVDRGDLSEERLDEALARAEHLRTHLTDRFGGDVFAHPERAVEPDEVASDPHRWLAARTAREAITVLDGTVHLESGEGVWALLVRPHTSPLDPPEQPLGAALRAALPGITYREVGPDTTASEREALLAAARTAHRVIVALVVKPAAWHAFGLPPEQEQFVDAVIAAAATTVVSLGSPRVLERYAGAEARVCTYSDAPVAQRALAAIVAGAHPD